MSPRLWTALSVSLIMHAALWAGNYLKIPQAGRLAPVFADSVLLDPSAYEAVRRARAAQSAPKRPKKKHVGIKPSSLPAIPKAAPVQSPPPAVPADRTPSRGEALESEKTANTSPRDGVRSVQKSVRPEATKPKREVRSGSDLLADPKTRGLFGDYFGLVKAQIQAKLREKCEGRNVGRGSVALAFVLQSDGRLRQVSVVDRNSEANLLLRELALESLRAAAPFSGFPGDFQAKQIAFNLTVYFDDL